jgi:hypothetical protein
MAIRFRSRQETCITGSYPARVSRAHMPTLDMWTLAPEASVALMASATEASTNARS